MIKYVSIGNERAMNRLLKLYLDTSIPNFIFAEDAKEKQRFTRILFSREVRQRFEFYISGVVFREIEKAPKALQIRLLNVLEGIEVLALNNETEDLAHAYLKANALPLDSVEDARHIAIATVHNMDAVVSWNFKHLVNLRRVKLVNLVNEQMGYKHIEIVSPQEVIF